jgi:hypothetical protein
VTNLAKIAATSALLFAFCGCGNNKPRTLDNEEASIACASNIRHIEDAKKSWAQRNAKGVDDIPTADDLDPFFRRGMPTCPGGGTYTIGKVGEPAQCSIAAHNEYYKSHQDPGAGQ